MNKKNLQAQVDELNQTPDHRLTSFEVRSRRLLVQLYELLEDIQIQNRDMDNRLESLSSQILDNLPPIKSGKPPKK